MNIRNIAVIFILIFCSTTKKAISQPWAFIPGYVSADYKFGTNKHISRIGSCFGIESQLYGNHIITGLVANTGTNKYMDFNEGHFLKIMFQFGLGDYTLGGDDKLRGFGIGFSGGLLEATNGFQNINRNFYNHLTGLGLGLFANVAISNYIQLSYNYDVGGPIKFSKYDVEGDFILHTLSLKLFRWISLNYSRFSDPKLIFDYVPSNISVRPEQLEITNMVGNYFYFGFIVTFDNHAVYEKVFFPDGY